MRLLTQVRRQGSKITAAGLALSLLGCSTTAEKPETEAVAQPAEVLLQTEPLPRRVRIFDPEQLLPEID